MKFMNQARFAFPQKYRAEAGADGDQGGGDGGDNNGDNNGSDNASEFVDLWKKPEDKSGQQGQQGQQMQQQQQGQQNNDPQKVLRQHLDSLNLQDKVDLSQLVDEQGQFSSENLGKALQQVGENVYISMMQQANKMIKASVEQGQKAAVEQAAANQASQSAVSAMHKALPFTKEPQFEKPARDVLAQMISKGKSEEDAIQSVQNYFNELSGAINSGNTNSGNDSGQQNADTDMDWGAILGNPTN